MMAEHEIKNWLEKEREKLPCIVDPTEKACCIISIAILEGVLGE